MKIEDVRFKAKIKEVDELIDVARIDFVNKEVSIELEQIVGFGQYWFEDVEEILPYTGFKDKNGESIYDRDFIKIMTGKIVLVKFVKGSSHLTNEYGVSIGIIGDTDYLSTEPYERLGSIYENPEIGVKYIKENDV